MDQLLPEGPADVPQIPNNILSSVLRPSWQEFHKDTHPAIPGDAPAVSLLAQSRIEFPVLKGQTQPHTNPLWARAAL